jgi:hypothetical protein
MEESSSLTRLHKPTPPANTITAELGSKVGSRVGVPGLTNRGPNFDEGLVDFTPAPSFPSLEAREVVSTGNAQRK